MFQSISGIQDCAEEDANKWLPSDDDPDFETLHGEIITYMQ